MRFVWWFVAACAAVVPSWAKVVYETGFEYNMQLPPGWAIQSYAPGPDWGFGGNPDDWHMRVRYGAAEQDEWLLSPVLDLSNESGIKVQFWQWFRTLGNGVGQLRVSVDGGSTWETVVEYSSDYFGEPIVPVPQASGKRAVRFCWRYLAAFDYQWDVDDVRILSEVPVDLGVTRVLGPSPDDYVRQGASLVVRVVFKNEGNQPSPAGSVVFSLGGPSWSGPLPSGIPSGDTLALSFTLPGSLVTAGDKTLAIRVQATGDAVSANDTLSVGPLHVIDWFPSPGTVLVNFDDPADSSLFVSLLQARGETYDCWNRKAGYLDRNLYGLEAWRVVVFTETELYPSLPEQLSLMRFLDQPSPGLKRGLVLSGDQWLHFAQVGVVSSELVESYLRLQTRGSYTQPMPNLFPVPGNILGLSQIYTTSAQTAGVLAPHPQLSGASVVLTYDEARQFGAMAAIRTPHYLAVAAGFEWGQLVVHQEQVALAGTCLDWLRAARGEVPSTGQLRLEVSPNPATDRLVLRLAEPPREVVVASLWDVGGRKAAQWSLASARQEVALPASLASGTYCLVLDTGSRRGACPVVVCR